MKIKNIKARIPQIQVESVLIKFQNKPAISSSMQNNKIKWFSNETDEFHVLNDSKCVFLCIL